MTENDANGASQNGKAKSDIVSQIARIVRKHGLTYDDWRYVSKRVRQVCELRPAKKPTTFAGSTRSWIRPTTCSTP
jgi:hypothetical protein